MIKCSFSQFSGMMVVSPENEVRRFEEAREILGPLVGVELCSRDGLRATLSKSSLEKILSGKAAKKSVSYRTHLVAAGNIRQLFSAAVELEKDTGRKPNLKFMHRLYSVFCCEGEVFLAKLSVKEFEDADSNRLYSVESLKIENPDGNLESGNPAESETGLPRRDPLSAKIKMLVAKVNSL